MMAHTTTMHRSRASRGFTLVELLVVISIIALVAGMTLPTVVEVFQSSADAQVYGVVNSMLRAARAYAIEHSVYTCVHLQPADTDIPQFSDKPVTYGAVMAWNAEDGYFEMPGIFEPEPLPGGMGVGSVLDEFLNNRKTVDLPSDWERFLTVNVIFSPEGKVVRQGPTGEPKFNMNSPLFDGDADVRIWNDNASAWGIENYGVTAMTFFSLEEVMRLTGTGDVEEYLADKSAFVAINLYTGQLFPRE